MTMALTTAGGHDHAMFYPEGARADYDSAAAPGAGSAEIRTMAKRSALPGEVPSQLIDARIVELGDWRGKLLARLRGLILEAHPGVLEDWKWGVPVWSSDGIICTGETYKSTVKLTFAKGASLPDPAGLFNSSLEGNTRRAIDVREGDRVDAKALQALVREAAALNAGGPTAPAKAKGKPAAAKVARSAAKAPAARGARPRKASR